ncbi:hypothetical protein ABB29_06720 [Pseudoxanthomonas dokdonensis]|uniref:Uncharacterized protein n=1 Tax=Pseudoxanthomonas dokdonensis TaxID=344882 RepID=A0A0R0CM02_9GAMM|nr:hypothetical protein ABB29_06720 [Pseudoxanthomonas dokdonensis]
MDERAVGESTTESGGRQARGVNAGNPGLSIRSAAVGPPDGVSVRTAILDHTLEPGNFPTYGIVVANDDLTMDGESRERSWDLPASAIDT